MNEAIFEKFNSMFDIEGLKKDMESVGTSDFIEVPKGDYEVKISKIELGETGEKSKTPGMPMAKVWFEILAGEYAGQKIFMNQMLTSAFGIHKTVEFLNSLETGIPVQFEDFVQFADVMEQVFREVDGKAEYALNYSENNKGFATYTITKRFK